MVKTLVTTPDPDDGEPVYCITSLGQPEVDWRTIPPPPWNPPTWTHAATGVPVFHPDGTITVTTTFNL